MIPSVAHDQAQECAALVTATFSTLFDSVRGWGQQLARFADSHPVPIARIELDRFVEAMVYPELDDRDSLVAGAGFVVGKNVLDDPDFYLSWWLSGTALPRKRENQSFTDYSLLEWWQVPVSTGRAHITGPYIDYLCTEDYALTLTIPVAVDGAVLGVVGLDIPVHQLERTFLAQLRQIDSTATLINAAGRIIVSTDPHRATGSVLRIADLPALWADADADPDADPGAGAAAAGAGAGAGAADLATAAAATAAAPVGGRRLIRCGELNVAILID